jgi:hypothetical protein
MLHSSCLAASGGPLDAINREYPGWHAWLSSASHFYAARKTRRKRPYDADYRWAMTVHADTADELREAIVAQEARSGP